MKRALVTGGCGFLGSWVVRQLIEEHGANVRVLSVPGESRENIADLDVEMVVGDVRSRDDATKAVAGCDTVFHLAAIYQEYAPNPWPMYDVNMRGTFNMLEAARRADVERVVYTASMASIGRPERGETAPEDAPYECWDVDFPYSRSKLFSREIAEYFADWDLDVRIICPGIVLGPGDLRPTPSGALIVKAFLPWPTPYWDGGVNLVDVRDAAAVHVLAAMKGRAGERYLATGVNVTNEEFVDAIHRASGKRKAKVKLPLTLARSVATAMDHGARLTGIEPLLAREFFEYCLKPSFYRNDKARRELGATFRPIEETIRDAIAYFRDRGVIRA